MASTPPPAKGSPEDVAWKRWAEERLLNTEVATRVTQARVESAVQQASTTGSVAAEAAIATVGLQGDIGTVIDTVDGLNKIFYEAAANIPTAHAQGDLWYVVDPVTSYVTGIRIWDGGSWNPYQFAADSVIVPGTVGTIQLKDGAVTAATISAEALNGKTIKGAYIEAPTLASSAAIAGGTNALADPSLAGAVDANWIASGHLGVAPPVQTDTITWDQTRTSGDSTMRYRGNIVADMTVKPLVRVTGSLVHTHAAAVFSTTPRTVTDPYTYTWNQNTAGWEPALAEVDTVAAAAVSTRTSYLTNSATVALVSGERWAVRLTYADITPLTAVNISSAYVQVINASTSAVIWQREITQTELASSSSINDSFIAASTVSAKFRIAVTYRAAGAGIQRTIRSGGYRAMEGTGAINEGYAPAYNLDESSKNLTPDNGAPALGALSYDQWQLAGSEVIFNRARTNLRLTSAFLGKYEAVKGFLLDTVDGMQFFNTNGARTGRLDGQSNFLAGEFATAEAGVARLGISASKLQWLSTANTVTESLTQADVTALRALLNRSRTIPIGVVMPYAGFVFTPPSGTLLCDGSAVSRTTYALLFSAIGTAYGVGDGSTTFNLPNLKGSIPVGQDGSQPEFDIRGEVGGAKTHTLLTTEIPSHTHRQRLNTSGYAPGGGSAIAGLTSVGFGDSPGGLANQITEGTGGGGAHNNLQPYVVMNYIIQAL